MSVRYIALLCFLSAGPALAQVEVQDNDRTIAYYNRLSTGILVGGQHGMVTGSVTTIHGISLGQVALGVGVGLEGYERWRTVPIFGSLSYYPNGARESGAFLQLDAGHAICRLLTAAEEVEIDGSRGGFMFSSTLGYQLAVGKLLVNLSAGYKMQKMRGHFTGVWSPLRYTIEEQADRFVFQIGVGFK